jgi:2-dehydropantoate 2-reductase
MRFHVLGLGPVGCLISHHLRLVLPPQHAISIIFKNRRDANRTRGVVTVESGGVPMLAKGIDSEVLSSGQRLVYNSQAGVYPSQDACYSPGEEVKAGEPIDSLLVGARANSTVGAIAELLPRISSNTTIVLLQNGMGIHEKLLRDFFSDPERRPHFILSSVTHAAWFKGFLQAVHSHVGNIKFGIVPDPMGRNFEASFYSKALLSRQLNDLSLDDITTGPNDPSFTRYRSLRSTVAALSSLQALRSSWGPISQIQVAMHHRLVVTAVIHSLTAVLGCYNGDLFAHEASLRIVRRFCQEAAAVFAAQHVSETQKWIRSRRIDQGGLQRIGFGRVPSALSAHALEEDVLRVANLRKNDASSMLLDIRRGRRTDIDYLHGYLLTLGETYHIPMPTVATLLNLVKLRGALPLN